MGHVKLWWPFDSCSLVVHFREWWRSDRIREAFFASPHGEPRLCQPTLRRSTEFCQQVMAVRSSSHSRAACAVSAITRLNFAQKHFSTLRVASSFICMWRFDPLSSRCQGHILKRLQVIRDSSAMLNGRMCLFHLSRVWSDRTTSPTQLCGCGKRVPLSGSCLWRSSWSLRQYLRKCGTKRYGGKVLRSEYNFLPTWDVSISVVFWSAFHTLCASATK